MPSAFYLPILLAFTSTLLLASCFPQQQLNRADASNKQADSSIEVTITSLDELYLLFDKYNYNNQNWHAGNYEVPRLTISGTTDSWRFESSSLPVKTKKDIFFRIMTPMILMVNEQIEYEREQVINNPLDSLQLKNIAIKYKILQSLSQSIDEHAREELLKRVDSIPVSLALAQAAEESGWATSRFAQQGNAFFGQWDHSGNGMKPREHRKELGNYGVKRFDSPLASIQAYMFNLNTNPAYLNLRNLRLEIKNSNKKVTGYELAGALENYSERGPDYIDSLRHIIAFNELQIADNSYLSNNSLLNIIGE